MSVEFLLSVPNEILLHHVLPYMSFESIESLCSVNTRMSELCRNQDLWIRKLSIDYPDVWDSLSNRSNISDLPTIIPRQLYAFLHNSKKVPVIKHGDRIGYGYANISDQRVYMFLPESMLPSIVSNEPKYKVNQELSSALTRMMFPGSTSVLFLGFGNQVLGLYEPQEPEDYVIKILISDRPIVNIFHELTNNKGHPPIYGYIDCNGKFTLIARNRTPSLHYCDRLSAATLYDISGEIEEYSRIPKPPLTSKHQYPEVATLCNTIAQQLDDIGHHLGWYP